MTDIFIYNAHCHFFLGTFIQGQVSSVFAGDDDMICEIPNLVNKQLRLILELHDLYLTSDVLEK